MNPSCGECGNEDGDSYMECCGVYMCDDCADRHAEKWGSPDEPVPYTVTPAGRAMLKDGES